MAIPVWVSSNKPGRRKPSSLPTTITRKEFGDRRRRRRSLGVNTLLTVANMAASRGEANTTPF